MRHKVWTAVLAVLAIIVVGSIGASGSGSGDGNDESGQQISDTATETTAPADEAEATEEETSEAPAAPNPDGTYRGSCDYLLSGSPYTLVGEISLHNTGNVGVKVKTKISWPQLGSAPITMKKKVKVPYGKSKVVRFKRTAGYDEIDLLQSWQESHGYRDGCKYDAAFYDTYGPTHG